jgi:uncharacterized membrane protein
MNSQTTKIDTGVVAFLLALLAVVTGWEWVITAFSIWVSVVWTIFIALFAGFLMFPASKIRKVKVTENERDAVDKTLDVLLVAVIVMFAIQHELWYTLSATVVGIVLGQLFKYRMRRIFSETH